ncbi:MAG: bacterioferritin-associated ferredoxin [Alcanivorax sp.]|nr:bacterioferritin-associated ferredoxin [Alcanivorax sp.]
MYVCLCKGVTDNQIREAAHQGCGSLRDLRRELGVGGQCGKCVREAHEVLRDTRALTSAQSQAAATYGGHCTGATPAMPVMPIMYVPQPA